ncbi:transglycosylase domain-containing protein [Shewanella sp. WXL01]|uniref:transglycosylase domain-containing protein n=1 Tax=Shewanella sp. WXL01 TaxID=2709721 RepID=UPI001FDAAA91|nr:transglycosylase domain-containing protein [Shewanella sp. WXL01]
MPQPGQRSGTHRSSASSSDTNSPVRNEQDCTNSKFDNYRPERISTAGKRKGAASSAPKTAPKSAPKPAAKPRRSKLGLLLSLMVLALGYLLAVEVESSFYQAKLLHQYSERLVYQVKPQPTPLTVYPTSGPFDKRMGYVDLPQMLPKLLAKGYHISEQAQFSPQLLQYSRLGLFPPYKEKTQSGLSVLDCRAQSQFHFQYPQQVYAKVDDIPDAIATSLLFIENRELMGASQYHNPVVDWPRLAKATLGQITSAVGIDAIKGGGSTLATQIEKFRHSRDGLTRSIKDKLIQISSAMVRVYHDSELTYEARRKLVKDYLNTVPLSSAPGFGEVNGIGDGLKAWFGVSLASVNQLLQQPHRQDNASARGLAYRQVVALMIAQRRPSYYLLKGRQDLEALVDSHLRLMQQFSIAETALIAAAMDSKLVFVSSGFHSAQSRENTASRETKGVNAVRIDTAQKLGVDLFQLDRFDLSINSTLNQHLQQQVSDYLHGLSKLDNAKREGIIGRHLLSAEQLEGVIYSLTLYQTQEQQNLLRVQTDNNPQPFDINEGSKLELGSTAKLRVLVTYLDIVAELQQRFIKMTVADLNKVDVEQGDNITRWVVDYLIRTRDRNLARMLDAALMRTYSASPEQVFFTGGAQHVFSNFSTKEDALTPTLYEALQGSINLPFVRLMQDIVSYSSSYNYHGSVAQLLHNDGDPNREQYLRAYARREGGQFVSRFYRKYHKQNPRQRLQNFYQALPNNTDRLAAAFRYLQPKASGRELKAFLNSRIAKPLSDKQVNRLYMKYGESKFSLANQGYLARVHPLELWVIKQLNQADDAGLQVSLTDLKQQSQDQLLAVYRWLFKTRHQNARDVRIKVMLEVDAFLSIHQRWEKWGYPFDYLVPSLASALGSSGDRPAALAELMGIIQNQGKRLPRLKVSQLHFAEDTPYEVKLNPNVGDSANDGYAEQVLHSEVASVLKKALANVVNQGTAIRLSTKAKQYLPNMQIGGKTGTGDNRIVTEIKAGRKLSSVAVNRTATFVFYIGDSFYGTITAYVPGRQADSYRFTSSLPLQVLNGLLPMLAPYIQQPEAMCQPELAQSEA